MIVSDIEYSREHRTVLLTITVACRFFKLILEAWIITKFIRVFQYFIKRKSQKKALSPFNKFIIVWTLVNFGLKCLNALFVFSILTLFQYLQLTPDSPLDRPLVLFLYQVTLRSLVILTDLLNALTILYLYFY